MLPNIDKIYITHWAKLIDRKKYLTERFKFLNIEDKVIWMEKWDKRNCNSSEFTHLYEKGRIDLWVERGNIKHYQMDKNTYRDLCDAEIFNFLNHIECYKDAIKNNYEKILILEDDIILPDNFIENLNKYMEQLIKIPNWDAMFIGTYLKDITHVKEPKQITSHLFLTNSSNTVDSYILNTNTIKKILNSDIFPFVYPIDFEFNYWIKNLNLQVYWGMPGITHQGSLTHYKSSVTVKR